MSGQDDQADEVEGGSIDDIELSIRKEVSEQKSIPKLFSPVPLDLQCVLFFKIRPPLDPVDFVQRICEEVVSNPTVRKMKYANRLTPMTLMGKATEKGLEELGRTVLGEHFKLEAETGDGGEGEAHQNKTSKPAADYSVSFKLLAVRWSFTSLEFILILRGNAALELECSMGKSLTNMPTDVLRSMLFAPQSGTTVPSNETQSSSRLHRRLQVRTKSISRSLTR